MRFLLLISLIVLGGTTTLAAEKREHFYGTWGTEKQCANAPIKQGGTVLQMPFEISSGWLKHGQLWCKLNWGPIEVRPGGLFTAAFAQCGEDAVRSYFLGMELVDNNLNLRWDLFHLNGPLARCSAP